jgi:hypothetical protein
MRMTRPRFTLLRLMIAVGIMGVLFAALRYDVGMRGYIVFLVGFAAFASSAVVASRVDGPARIAALSVAAMSCIIGLAAFILFGTR